MFYRRFFRPLLPKHFKWRSRLVADSFRSIFSMKRYTTPFLGSTRFVSSKLHDWCEDPGRLRRYVRRDSRAKMLKRSNPLAQRMERKFERILVSMYKNLGVGGEFSVNRRVVKLPVSMNQKALDLKCVIEYLNGKSWKFYVVDTRKLTSKSWGGRIAVATRHIFTMKSEAEVAFVIGHEIAHAVAQHGKDVFCFMVYMLKELQIPILSKIFNLIDKFWMRREELEADHMGLMIIALAGYDPKRGVESFLRLKPSKETWLSKHPSYERRRELLMRPEIMGKAIMLYEAALASTKQDKNAPAIEAPIMLHEAARASTKQGKNAPAIEAHENKRTMKRSRSFESPDNSYVYQAHKKSHKRAKSL